MEHIFEKITYGPNDAKGRTLKEDTDGYMWVYLAIGPRTVYCKIHKDDYEKASRGEPFMVWNPFVPAPQGGFAYLPAGSMSIEPWFITKVDMIAMVHHTAAENLDRMAKQAFSEIVVAKEMPKETPKAEFFRG